MKRDSSENSNTGRNAVKLSLLAASALTIGAALGGGCSGTTDNSSGNDFSDVTSSTTGGGGTGGSSTTTTVASSSTGVFVGSGGSSTSTGTGVEDGGQCASASAKAQLTPLDIIIMLDQSGSMEGNSWTEVTAAIKAFVADPDSAGIGIGINYFGTDASQGPFGDECDWQAYAQLEVPVDTLPGNATAMSDSIDAHMPDTDTPMYPALKGALAAGTAYQDANPTHKVIVVLATDGEPGSGCANDNIPMIAGLAESAINYNGVQTYTIAVTGADLMSLDQISAAGGTVMSYDATNVMLFEQEMKAIRTNALACDFPIPPPPDGQMFDANKVNVSYTPGGSTTAETLPRADNLQDCGQGAGWYYDNPASPTKIELCPSSCMTVQADTTAELDVLFGCKTKIN